MNNIKRFRIFDADGQQLIGKYDTTEEVYNAGLQLDRGLAYYFIDCVVDDIEVPLDDFMAVWEDGERPEDLQFF